MRLALCFHLSFAVDGVDTRNSGYGLGSSSSNPKRMVLSFSPCLRIDRQGERRSQSCRMAARRPVCDISSAKLSQIPMKSAHALENVKRHIADVACLRFAKSDDANSIPGIAFQSLKDSILSD